MSTAFAELTVLVPVSQYVKVEAEAAARKRSLDSTASFLLSKWVHATHHHQKNTRHKKERAKA